MIKKLIITNGDMAADLLVDSGIDADILPWQDVLHMGPLSAQKDEGTFNRMRANYLSSTIAEQAPEAIEKDLAARDHIIDKHSEYDQIELWFEHDLYDQLQILQVLTALFTRKRKQNVSIVQAPTYLGMQKPETILKFANLIIPVTTEMFEASVRLWNAVGSSQPDQIFDEYLNGDIPGFYFMRQGLQRLLQELPDLDGLNRTQRQMLYSIERGVNKVGPLFSRCSAMEDGAFWGDTGFFYVLSELQYCEAPLIQGINRPFTPQLMASSSGRQKFLTSELDLTELGRQVLQGKDYAEYNVYETWVGGTRITNSRLWRWNDDEEELISPNPLH